MDFRHSDNPTPFSKLLGNQQEEIEMLHAENALKLTQILDLEQTLYDTRVIDMDDNSPCWCVVPYVNEGSNHEDFCTKARQATEPFWKK